MRLRYLLPLGVFVGLVALLAIGLGLNPRLVPSPLIGKATPDFELSSLTEPAQTLTEDDLKGQVSLLNVWATWCVACRAEHEFLMALAQQGVPIYGVNYKDERQPALRWLATLGDPYVASIYDPQGILALDLGVYGAPETFVLDRNGVVAYKHIGPLTLDVWHEKLLPLVQKLVTPQG